MKPLNGEKTHPLKPGAIAVLRDLARGSVPAYQINPGVRDRLLREDLAREECAGRTRVYVITDAGRAALAASRDGAKKG